MALHGSPYPPIPGEKHSTEAFDGTSILPRKHTFILTIPPDNQLHSVESPDYDVKDESECPTNLQYMRRHSQVTKVLKSSPIPTTQKLEHSHDDTGDTGHNTFDTEYRLPTYNTSSRPFSYPVGSTSAYSHSVNKLYQAQPWRPMSYVGTLDDPYRMQYGRPTLFTNGGTQLQAPSHPFDPYAAVFAPHPSATPESLQYLPDVPSKDKKKEHKAIDRDTYVDEESGQRQINEEEERKLIGQKPSTGEHSDTGDGTEGEQPTSTIKRKTGQRGSPILNFEGYPDHKQIPSADLSCYEVCQQYPASLMNDNLLPFIQRRWSAEEIFDCLPLDVQQYVHDRRVDQKTMYLYKRLQKGENKLKGLSPSGTTGTLDITAYLALLNGPRMRDDGRPADTKKNQSVAAPHRVWRRRHGVGVDPDTGLYVEVAAQPAARLKVLMATAPADALTSQFAAPNQAANIRPLPNPLRLRAGRRKGSVRSASAIHSTPVQAPDVRRHRPANGIPRAVYTASAPDQAPVNTSQDSTPASGTVGTGLHDQAQPAYTPPPNQPFVGNFSDTRSPTLASMFPDGMINMCGAYVRVVSPGGTSMWHGAPSAEFIENYTSEDKFRLWMDVNLPQQYRPDAPYPSLLTANAPATFRTGVADWLDLEHEFELPHERKGRLEAEWEARVKRKAEAVEAESAEEVGRPMKKARTEADAGDCEEEEVLPDEATQAIIELLERTEQVTSPDGGPRNGLDVETADNIADEANEEDDPPLGEGSVYDD